MWFTSLLASLKRNAGHQLTRQLAQGRRARRRRTATFKPSIEALENRTLLSGDWVAPAPGEWSDGANWSDGQPPSPNDDVVLPALPGIYTVSQFSICKSLRFDDPSALSIGRGVLMAVLGPATLNGALNIDTNGALESRAGDPWTIDGAVTLSGRLELPGHLSTATGSSAINGPVTWTGGSILGGSSTFPVMLNSTITISGPDRKALRTPMNINQGAQIVHQGGDLDDGDATLNILGRYELQTDATITQFTDVGYFNVKNGGVLLKSGGSGVATVGGEFTINAGGQVVNQTGTLNLQLNSDGNTGGTFVVAEGARVSLVGSTGFSGPAKLVGTYTGSGRGTVELKTDIAVGPGTVFNFPGPVDPPNGDLSQIIIHLTGAENGLSDITAPLNSMVGVYLGPDEPDLTPAPAALDFSTAASRDMDLAPVLKQVFFIGDGLTSAGGVKHVTAPAGATRLYLGTMNGSPWKNASGAFSVQVGVNSTPLDHSFPVLVPGISDPWLAGMPDGSTASMGDVAPAQSPALVPDLAVNAGDVLTFTGKGSVNFYPSMFEWTAGTIFAQNGGDLTNKKDTGFMRIAPSSPFGVNLEAPLDNRGTITQTAGLFGTGPSGVFNNHGIYDLQTDGGSIGGYTFINESDGILRKSLNTGLAGVTAQFSNHGGTIEVQRGTLDLSGSTGSHTGSTFYTADGTTLIPFFGTSTGTYTGARAGSGVVLYSSSLTVGTGGATLDFEQDGMLQWSGTQIATGSDGLINSGSLTLIGSSHHFVGGSGGLTNNGRIIHAGSGGLALTFGTSLVNNGFYDLQGDASIGVQQGGTFQNNGMFIKSQGTGTSTNDNWVNNNGGTIDLGSGTLRLTDSFTNNGTVIIAAGRTLDVSNYIQSGTGTLEVQLGGAPASGQFGKLTVGSATLAGTLQVDLVNGYGGNPGDVFTILTFRSVQGDFDNFILPPGAVWDVTTGTVTFPGP